jgi:dUTPase
MRHLKTIYLATPPISPYTLMDIPRAGNMIRAAQLCLSTMATVDRDGRSEVYIWNEITRSFERLW